MEAFALYPEERHWWSFADYGHVLDVVRARGARTVLEFGPGSSTLALIEGGAELVDTCEDDPHWLQVHRDRTLAGFGHIVAFHPYQVGDPIAVPSIAAGTRYDLALVDGPLATAGRAPAIRYALERADAVLVPCESGAVTEDLRALAAEFDRDLAITETGPLAGAFGLLTPKATAPTNDAAETDAPARDAPAPTAERMVPAVEHQPLPSLHTPEVPALSAPTRGRHGGRHRGRG